MNLLLEPIVLDRVLADLKAEGYEVHRLPSPSMLPDFLRGSRPDAIALRPDGNLVISIIRGTRGAGEARRLEALKGALQGREGWALKEVPVVSRDDNSEPPIVTRERVRLQFAEARRLIEEQHPRAALLLAWAAFEALARHFDPGEFRKPQTPARIIETLTHLGHVTNDEAATLFALVPKRNAFIHGDLDHPVSVDEVTRMIDILEVVDRENT